MNNESHGGHCCGMSHIWGFNVAIDKATKDLMETITQRVSEIEERARENYEYDEDEEDVNWTVFGHCIEIVLTDSQMLYSGWAPVLKKKGFKLCDRWFNDNSGNYCNLLTYKTKEPETPAPYEW